MTNFLRTKMNITSTQLWTITLTILAFSLYYIGLAPSLVTILDDSPEFAVVVQQLAIAHPTGYPLYILLGKFFSLVNLQNVAYQLNVMSAFFGALTVGLTGLICLNLRSDEGLAWPDYMGATLGALILASGSIFYSQATLAEVYTLNSFFVLLSLLLTIRKQWVWLAFVLGLSLTHHRTMVLLGPALVGFWIWDSGFRIQDSGFRIRDLGKWGKKIGGLCLAFGGPLGLYLYLPLRGDVGSLDGSYEHTWAGFWQHISGGGYGTFLLNNPFGHERGVDFYFNLIQGEVGWVGLLLASVGVGWLIWKRRWGDLILTGLAGVTYFGFNIFYAVSDIEVFFIPVFVILAVWAGLGSQHILGWLAKKNTGLSIGVGLVMLGFIFSQANYQSRAETWAVYDYAHDVLAQAAPESAVVGILGEMTILRYFQNSGLRPDVATYPADLEADRLAEVEALLTENPQRPVYLTRELAGLPERWSVGGVGPLLQVHPSPLTDSPLSENGMTIALTPAITLVNYTVEKLSNQGTSLTIRLTVVWHVTQPITQDLKVSARLLASNDEVAAVVDKVPVHFAYPTSFWREGEYISDVYDLQLSSDTVAESYIPLLILYDPARNAVEVGRVTLPTFALPH